MRKFKVRTGIAVWIRWRRSITPRRHGFGYSPNGMDFPRTKPIRGLIVDDHPLVCQLMTWTIEHFGYELAGVAYNGEEAIETARTHQPDFIVMDLEMPVMDGITATRRILAERQLPIVLCSGTLDSGLKMRALEAGARAVLLKPCPTHRMKEVLSEFFDGAAAN